MSLLLPYVFNDPLSFTQVIQMSLVGLAVCVLTGVVSGFRFSRNIRNRLEEISVGARNLAYGNLRYRLPFTGDTEVGDIALAFNEMAERLEIQVLALQQLAEENEQLIRETKVAAVSEERQRLARDLHDAISQQLFAISMMAATASKIADTNPEKCSGLVAEIEESARKAQSEMRALLLQLRPITLQNESLVDAITSLAAELEGKGAIKCRLSLTDNNISLPKNIENQLYRITQEGLSNVLRHAEANEVEISLSFSHNQQRLLLVIEDDGRGFSENDVSKTSFGIRSIKERATLLGGTAQWISIPSKGTRLEVRIPIVKTARGGDTH